MSLIRSAVEAFGSLLAGTAGGYINNHYSLFIARRYARLKMPCWRVGAGGVVAEVQWQAITAEHYQISSSMSGRSITIWQFGGWYCGDCVR